MSEFANLDNQPGKLAPRRKLSRGRRAQYKLPSKTARHEKVPNLGELSSSISRSINNLAMKMSLHTLALTFRNQKRTLTR
jgi:hypothetical protein